MKKFATPFFLVTFCFYFALSTNAQEATLVSQVQMQEANHMVLHLSGNIYTTYWERDYVQVKMEISSNLDSRTVIKHLIAKGRYKIQHNQYDDTIIVSMPNMKTEVFVNDIAFYDAIKFKVYVPYGKRVSYWDKLDDAQLAKR